MLNHPMVHCDSEHPFHSKIYKTLVLLKIETKDAPVYFVVEGLGTFGDDLRDSEQYFYEEHTCPTNFIDIPMISYKGDTDPHGVFEFVDAVWMTQEYVDLEYKNEYLVDCFPQLKID